MVNFHKLYLKVFKTMGYASWAVIFLIALFWYCGDSGLMQKSEIVGLGVVLIGLSVYILTEIFEFFYKRI